MLCLRVWSNLTYLLFTPTYFQARNSLDVRIPLLIKIAPDLSQAEMEDIAEVIDICFCEVQLYHGFELKRRLRNIL